MTLTVLHFSAAHVAGGHGLTTALRWPHRLEDWQSMHDLGRGIALTDGGNVIGTGLWWPHGPDHATVGMILVAAAAQGRGLGRRIMETLLADLDGRALMLNATAAGGPLYERLGFTPIGGIRQVQGLWQGTTGLSQGIRPATAADLPALLALDQTAFGAPRLTALPASFSAGQAVILETATPPIGFAITRPFGRGVVIGPVVAPDEAAAAALITAAATQGAFTRLDIPADAPALLAFLQAHGLAEVDVVTPMTRGLWSFPGPAQRYGLISQALG